jgi:peptidoglycan/LPS O-acetylase OafA/YrhL
MTETSRRYDIDWLRIIAIALLIVYHIGIGFQPWGVLIGFIQNEESLTSIWPVMAMLNIWRIPLLFFVSGMGVCFAMRKRSWEQLLGERTRRILLPLIFGSVLIVPVHLLIWQQYYNQDFSYQPSTGHLWFLANIFIYVLILLPLFSYLKKHEDAGISRRIKKAFSTPVGLLLILLFFIIEVLIINPESFETYFDNIHGFILGFLAFLFGFLIVFTGNDTWNILKKWKLLFLAISLILYLCRWLVFDFSPPILLYPIESNSWIFAAFGFAYQYLNKPSKALGYLSQAAYPVYIIHMIFIYLGSFLLFPLNIHEWIKLFILILFTFLACFLAYEFLIKRVKLFRPLFGLKAI